jgi:hypothetical protein
MDAAEGRLFLLVPVNGNSDHVAGNCAAFVSRAIPELAVDPAGSPHQLIEPSRRGMSHCHLK